MNTSLTKQVGVAMLTAIAMMAAGGTTYRVLAPRLARPSDSVPLTSAQLGVIPMQIGQWLGRDVALDEAIIRATDTDAHVNRLYIRGNQAVSIFVAYGTRARDLMPHRPEVCYPSNGWTAAGSETIDLTIADGSFLPCTIYRFERGGLSRPAVTVLNYYIVDGQYSPDVSLLRRKAWRGSAGVRYMAQVQICSAAGGDAANDSASQVVSQFAAQVAGEIRAVLPTSGAQQAGESPTDSPDSQGPAS